MIVAIFLLGSFGYMLIEGWALIDAFYMTVITLSTVGFQEVQPLSQEGRVFTAFMIVLGIGTFGYGFGSLVAFFIEGELTDLIRTRKMEKIIESLRNHVIVCGYGNEGRHAVTELAKSNTPILIIEKNEILAEKLAHQGQLVIQGDATDDDILQRAGVATAKGLIAAVHEDTQNVFLTLTARGFNPGLTIVAKASAEASVPKLYRAGANKVVSSAEIGGHRMASALIRPSVVHFLDVIMSNQDLALRLEEVTIAEGSAFDDKSIRELHVRARTGALVIGYQRKSQPIEVNPEAGTVLQADDILLVLGNDVQLKNLQKIAGVRD